MEDPNGLEPTMCGGKMTREEEGMVREGMEGKKEDEDLEDEDDNMSEEYESIIGTRYLAPELSPIWSKENRVLTMRKLWLALAKTQKKLGLVDIPDEAIEEMTQNLNNIDIDKIDEYEILVEYDMIHDMDRFIDEKEREKAMERENDREKMRSAGATEEDLQLDKVKEIKEKEHRQKEIREIRKLREKDMLERERELCVRLEKRKKERQEKEQEREREREQREKNGEKDSEFGVPSKPVYQQHEQDSVVRNTMKEVMMNLLAFEDLCPKAKGYLNIGVGYNYVSENCELILMKKSLNTLISKLFLFINFLMKKSHEYIDKPYLTQMEQNRLNIITLGKKIAIWNSDLMDIFDQWAKLSFPFRGVIGELEDEIWYKAMDGTGPGTGPGEGRKYPRPSFCEKKMVPFKLFKSDVKLCNKFNTELVREFDFSPNKVMIALGKTHMRTFDIYIAHLLGRLSQVILKIMMDVRHLVAQEDLKEGFGESEEDMSLFKITPMTAERVCSLTKYVIFQELGMNRTYSSHWLDRSMDDTAVKKIVLPESFLLTEHIIDCSYIIFNKMIFHTDIIDENVVDFIHHIIREELVMRGNTKGVPRKDIEERLRKVILEYEKFEKIEKERERLEKLKEEEEEKQGMKVPSYLPIEEQERLKQMQNKPPSWKMYDVDVKTRQERAKIYFRSDPILYRLIDLPPIALNMISLNSKDYMGSAPIQVAQLNHFFSSKTSSLFWIK